MCKRFTQGAGLLALVVAVAFPLPVNAQSQDTQNPPVVEAARRARELKKKSDKPIAVVTEDTLNPAAPEPSHTAATSVPTENTAPVQPAPAAAAGSPVSTPTAQPEESEGALKQQLAQAQKELGLSQTELALQQDSYFSNPDYVRDKAGKAKIGAIQLEINDKQELIERLKTRLAALQAQQGSAKEASTPSPSDEKPAAPAQP